MYFLQFYQLRQLSDDLSGGFVDVLLVIGVIRDGRLYTHLYLLTAGGISSDVVFRGLVEDVGHQVGAQLQFVGSRLQHEVQHVDVPPTQILLHALEGGFGEQEWRFGHQLQVVLLSRAEFPHQLGVADVLVHVAAEELVVGLEPPPTLALPHPQAPHHPCQSLPPAAPQTRLHPVQPADLELPILNDRMGSQSTNSPPAAEKSTNLPYSLRRCFTNCSPPTLAHTSSSSALPSSSGTDSMRFLLTSLPLLFSPTDRTSAILLCSSSSPPSQLYKLVNSSAILSSWTLPLPSVRLTVSKLSREGRREGASGRYLSQSAFSGIRPQTRSRQHRAWQQLRRRSASSLYSLLTAELLRRPLRWKIGRSKRARKSQARSALREDISWRLGAAAAMPWSSQAGSPPTLRKLWTARVHWYLQPYVAAAYLGRRYDHCQVALVGRRHAPLTLPQHLLEPLHPRRQGGVVHQQRLAGRDSAVGLVEFVGETAEFARTAVVEEVGEGTCVRGGVPRSRACCQPLMRRGILPTARFLRLPFISASSLRRVSANSRRGQCEQLWFSSVMICMVMCSWQASSSGESSLRGLRSNLRRASKSGWCWVGRGLRLRGRVQWSSRVRTWGREWPADLPDQLTAAPTFNSNYREETSTASPLHTYGPTTAQFNEVYTQGLPHPGHRPRQRPRPLHLPHDPLAGGSIQALQPDPLAGTLQVRTGQPSAFWVARPAWTAGVDGGSDVGSSGEAADAELVVHHLQLQTAGPHQPFNRALLATAAVLASARALLGPNLPLLRVEDPHWPSNANRGEDRPRAPFPTLPEEQGQPLRLPRAGRPREVPLPPRPHRPGPDRMIQY